MISEVGIRDDRKTMNFRYTNNLSQFYEGSRSKIAYSANGEYTNCLFHRISNLSSKT